MPLQVPPEVSERLNIAVRVVHHRVSVGIIPVRDDEGTARPEDRGNLGEFLGLDFRHILEEPLGDDDVERPVGELDGGPDDVGLDQVRSRLLDGNVNTVIVNGRREQIPQSGRPAADVQKIALPAPGHLVDDPHGLFHPVVRLAELEVLLAPKVMPVIPHRVLGASHGNGAVGCLVHPHLLFRAPCPGAPSSLGAGATWPTAPRALRRPGRGWPTTPRTGCRPAGPWLRYVRRLSVATPPPGSLAR